MSDATLAAVARPLAQALRAYARERRDADKKEIARLHTELCQAYNAEVEAEIDAEIAAEDAL